MINSDLTLSKLIPKCSNFNCFMTTNFCSVNAVRLDHLSDVAEYVAISNKYLKVVNKFFYLGDIIDAAGCVEESIVSTI